MLYTFFIRDVACERSTAVEPFRGKALMMANEILEGHVDLAVRICYLRV